jgi:hypothetical protein
MAAKEAMQALFIHTFAGLAAATAPAENRPISETQAKAITDNTLALMRVAGPTFENLETLLAPPPQPEAKKPG